MDEHLTISTIEMLLDFIDVSSCSCSREMLIFSRAGYGFAFSFAKAARVGEYELTVATSECDYL